MVRLPCNEAKWYWSEQKLTAGIVPSMGSAFGEEGSGFIRLNLGCPVEVLADALVRLKAALDPNR